MVTLAANVLTTDGLGIVIGIDLVHHTCLVLLYTSGKIIHLPLSAVSEVTA